MEVDSQHVLSPGRAWPMVSREAGRPRSAGEYIVVLFSERAASSDDDPALVVWCRRASCHQYPIAL